MKRILMMTALILLMLMPEGAAARLQVVTSFSILADFASQVGGELVDVVSLVPFGGDPHNWEPSPKEARTVANADVIFINGLGLEVWIEKLLANAANPLVPLIVLSSGLTALPIAEDNNHDHHDHDHGSFDPHMWLDVKNAQAYVQKICETYIQLDPNNADYYRQRCDHYLQELEALDEWLMTVIAQIPANNRKIITYHNAFAYFAKRYGLTVEAYLVVNPDREPNSKAMKQLVNALASHPKRVMFTEPQVSTANRYAEAAVSEVKGKLYVLYTGSLDKAAPTYVDMMRHNGQTLLEALK